MTSSRFNSPAALRKTPGVCHSLRPDQIPLPPPPPPGTVPGILYANVRFIGDIGFGTQDFSAFNLSCGPAPKQVQWQNIYILTATEQAFIRMTFIEDQKKFQVALVASNLTGPGSILTIDSFPFDPFPTPFIQQNILLPLTLNVQVAAVDVWS